MNCLECKGACCETFEIPAEPGPLDDASRWLALHATPTAGDHLSFECRCTALGADGRCTIYHLRPQVCRTYEPGGVDCLRTVKARRSPEEFQKIRGEEDPVTLG